MARLPYIDPENASEEVQGLLGRLPDLGIFRMVAHAETGFRGFLRLGNSILQRQELPDRLRELAILRVARLSGATYEWTQHVAIARRTGVTDGQIEALERGSIEGPDFTREEGEVLRFTTELVQRVRVSDETFKAMETTRSPREVVELILAVGYYMMVARLLETTEVDLEPPARELVERER